MVFGPWAQPPRPIKTMPAIDAVASSAKAMSVRRSFSLTAPSFPYP